MGSQLNHAFTLNGREGAILMATAIGGAELWFRAKARLLVVVLLKSVAHAAHNRLNNLV